MHKIVAHIAAALALAATASAFATPMSYATPGKENPVKYAFSVNAAGTLSVYFAGSSAGYTTELGLLINGVDTGIRGLNNHTAAYGQQLDFGSVAVGDKLVFKLFNVNSPEVGPFYSDTSMNPDHLNHVYAAWFKGDGLIPAGYALGFEDLYGGGDFDYNDENFVIVHAPKMADVPEPASAALLLAGVAGLAAARRKQRGRRA